MGNDLSDYQQRFLAALRQGDEAAARQVVDDVRATGVDGSTIYYELFAPSMVTIGDLWERNEVNVAEEHLATAITERLIGGLGPLFEREVASQGGVVLLGCVAGERHALGLRMLADLFRREGWRVLYLGADVASDDWVQMAIRCKADVIAVSASTPRLASAVKQLIEHVRAVLPQTMIVVGGAAFAGDDTLWREVGADIYDADSQSAVLRVSRSYLEHSLPHAS